jgi:hypothetical protein
MQNKFKRLHDQITRTNALIRPKSDIEIINDLVSSKDTDAKSKKLIELVQQLKTMSIKYEKEWNAYSNFSRI